MLTVITSMYNEINIYTVCRFDEKASTEKANVCDKVPVGQTADGKEDKNIVLNPFYPEKILPCSKRGDETLNLSEYEKEKFEFLCDVYGQGSKTKFIIFMVCLGIGLLLVTGCIVICGYRYMKDPTRKTISIEMQREESAAHDLVPNSPVDMGFESQADSRQLTDLMEDMRHETYEALEQGAHSLDLGMTADGRLDKICIVCKKRFEPLDRVNLTRCGHCYHHGCIKKQLAEKIKKKITPACPQCGF